MQRNQREERLKFIRREYKRWDDVDDVARKPHYIPLEKPQFAGWEVFVELSDSGKRRRDAPDIQYIMNLLGWSKLSFVRNLMVVRHIRRHNHRYDRVMNHYSKKGFLQYLNCSHQYRPRDLDEREYERLSPKFKAWFHEDTWTHKWFSRKFYKLNWNATPTYELVFKIRKAYWTHIKVYDGDAQGEAQRLRDKIWSGSYMNLVPKVMGFESRYRDDFRNSIKRAWSSATKKLKEAANSHLHDEEWYDIESDCTRLCYNSKPFGWD